MCSMGHNSWHMVDDEKHQSIKKTTKGNLDQVEREQFIHSNCFFSSIDWIVSWFFFSCSEVQWSCLKKSVGRWGFIRFERWETFDRTTSAAVSCYVQYVDHSGMNKTIKLSRDYVWYVETIVDWRCEHESRSYLSVEGLPSVRLFFLNHICISSSTVHIHD